MLVGVAKKPHLTSNLTRPNGHEHLISLLVAASHRALRLLMLFVTGKRILQTLREKKSNRKLIGIGYLFGLMHHNIFGLSDGQRQLLGQAEKGLLPLLFHYHIKFDNSFSDTIEIQ